MKKHLMNPIREILPINISNRERMISDGLGVALIVMGLLNIKQPSVKTFLELGTGALMLFRGATGYCPISAAIGRNTADIDDAAEEKFESLAE
jgi:uncharacterized membrane protein